MDASGFHLDQRSLTEAQRLLGPVVNRTPVVRSQLRDGVRFKAESLQVTGSFKIRPAYYQLATLTAPERAAGIVTSSSGNFAQGVSFAARLLGIDAKIVMMASSNPLKVERVRRWGGEVVFCEDRFEAREETVQEILRSEGRVAVFPYNHTGAVIGNATIGAEILDEVPDVQNVVVPISGGGLIAGILVAMELLSPAVRVWGVQPEGSNATYLSYEQGRRVSILRARTMADGLSVTQPGTLTFPVIQRLAAGVVTVSEQSILDATRELLLEEKLLVEPSGAVTLAAIVEGKVPSENAICVLSGGNIAPALLAQIAG